MSETTDVFDPSGDRSLEAPSRNGQRSADGAGRRNPRYELFILGELMNGAQHGYRLREILNRILGPFRQISWGSLYPLIHDLQRQGLIEETAPEAALPADGAGGRPRRTYALTPAGGERFYQMMREPSPYTPDYPELFILKLNLFAFAAAELQSAILRHHRGYLEAVCRYLRAEHDFVANRTTLPANERPHIMRMLNYRLTAAQAELAWTDEQLDALGVP